MATLTTRRKTEEQWVTVGEASKHFGVSLSKLRTTMLSADAPRNKKDPMDNRLRLVSLTDLQRIYERE